MKKISIICLLLVSLASMAQKKKELKKYGIKSITVTDISGTKSITDSKATYDNSGNLLEEINYNKEGNLKSTTRYKYNKDGDVTEETEYDEKNNLKEKRTIKYDSMGQKVEELTVDAKGNQVKKIIYVYDTRGFKTEKRTYDGGNYLVNTKKMIYTSK